MRKDVFRVKAFKGEHNVKIFDNLHGKYMIMSSVSTGLMSNGMTKALSELAHSMLFPHTSQLSSFPSSSVSDQLRIIDFWGLLSFSLMSESLSCSIKYVRMLPCAWIFSNASMLSFEVYRPDRVYDDELASSLLISVIHWHTRIVWPGVWTLERQ